MKRFLLSASIILLLSLQAPAHARSKVYHYDGDIPMVTFMLNMMVAMGLIDRMPNGYAGYGNGYPRSWRDAYAWKYSRNLPNNRYRSMYPGMPWNDIGWDEFDSPAQHPYLRGRASCDAYGCYRYSALDGVWLSSSGEMLGIRSNRMVWSDGEEAYAVGVIKTTPEHIYARLNGASTSTPYSYRIAGNQLNMRDMDGTVRRFYRLPGSQVPVSSRY